MLQVYLDPCTVNSRKVLAGLDLLGTQYELKHVDYFAGAHKEPEYLAINPEWGSADSNRWRFRSFGIQCDPAIRGRSKQLRQALSQGP